MTTYAFETITPAQALAVQAADLITFAGGPARGASLAYNIPVVGPASVTLTYGGRSVEFGLNLLEISEQGGLKFADDSRLLAGGTQNDNLTGWVHDDALFGGQGDDTLAGQDGNDLIQGNAGADRLLGERGADTVLGGQGNDVLHTGQGIAGEAGDYGHGNMGDDIVNGGGGADTLLGGQGGDSLYGGDGADYLSGDLGDDALRGGAGSDSQFGGAGADSLFSGGGADSLDGGAGEDVIIVSGGGGASVDGGDGNDTILAASPGQDVLQGGGGADRFEFVSYNRPAEGQDDEIRDWGASDTLHFDHFSIYSTTPEQYAELTAADYASALAQANSLIASGQVIYVAAQVGGDVVVFADTNGTAADGAETAVVLAGRTLAHIEAGDIV